MFFATIKQRFALHRLRQALARRRLRRKAAGYRFDFTVWDLRERYGEAAALIARSSATQTRDEAQRRFWKKVAATLARRGPSLRRP